MLAARDYYTRSRNVGGVLAMIARRCVDGGKGGGASHHLQWSCIAISRVRGWRCIIVIGSAVHRYLLSLLRDAPGRCGGGQNQARSDTTAKRPTGPPIDGRTDGWMDELMRELLPCCWLVGSDVAGAAANVGCRYYRSALNSAHGYCLPDHLGNCWPTALPANRT